MSPMRQWIQRNSNSTEWIEIQAEMLKYVVATENKTNKSLVFDTLSLFKSCMQIEARAA